MDKDIYIIISDFFSGKIDKEDRKTLQEWLSSSEENRLFFEDMRRLWETTTFKEHYSNKEEVFDKILNNIQVDDRESSPVYLPDYLPQNKWYKKPALIAASVLILLATSLSYYFYQHQQTEQETIAKIKWIDKINPAGQKSKIYLPDGSIAFLNAESSLRYIADFTDSSRDIYLEGEAFFEVKRDTEKPFRVHGHNIYVTALGTKFNVNSFSAEPSSLVSLVEGKVSINANEHFEILHPGESLVLRKEKNQISKFEVDIDMLVGWKDGMLLFDGDTLEEMVKKLERWYGVDISISGNPDKDMKYKGMFVNEYLSNVLESMRYGRDFDFTINGKNVKLIFNPK